MNDLMEVVSIFTGEKTDRSLGRHPEAGRRVVAVVGGPLYGDEDQATHYERSMQLLHDAVKALRLATGAHTPDVTIERVWPLYMVLNERDEGGFDPGNLIIVEDGWATTPTASPAKTNEAQALLTAIWSSDPVEIYRDFHLGARRAGETDGDYTECVLKAATAAEVLIKHTAWMLTWEATEKRRSDPAPGAKTMPPTGETKPSQLVGQVLAARLGGNWSSQREDQPIGAWRQAIAQMRNQVLHLGHRPNPQEARDALTALTLLEQHVLDRLAARAEKYPITALFLAGEEGLERRGARAKVRPTLRDHDLQELKSEYRAWLQAALQKDSEDEGQVERSKP